MVEPVFTVFARCLNGHHGRVAWPGIMVEPVFSAFATAAFFEFALFGVFEMRYLLHAWRARRGAALEPWAAQRELSVLYARFYGALLAGVFLSYQLRRCGGLPRFLIRHFSCMRCSKIH